MCGQLTAYNTYATLSYTNPLFLGFSCYQNVNQEIIYTDYPNSTSNTEVLFFFTHCGIIRLRAVSAL